VTTTQAKPVGQDPRESKLNVPQWTDHSENPVNPEILLEIIRPIMCGVPLHILGHDHVGEETECPLRKTQRNKHINRLTHCWLAKASACCAASSRCMIRLARLRRNDQTTSSFRLVSENHAVLTHIGYSRLAPASSECNALPCPI
jgi:hypothetical protein